MPGILDITAADKALKTYFLEPWRYQLNERSSGLLAQIERNSTSVVGKNIDMPFRYGRNGGYGAGDTLPEANSRKTEHGVWETKDIYGRIKISNKVIEASKSNLGAYANMLKTEMDDCLTDVKENYARQVFGDGSGKIATVTSVNNTGNVSVLTIAPVNGLFGIDVFAEGMLIDIYNSTGATKRNTNPVEVTIVDDVESKITLSVKGTNIAATDFITVQNSYNEEMTGLDAIVNAPTLYGLNRSSHKWLNCQKIAVNGEINELVIQKGMDTARRKAGSVTDIICCSFGVRRAYLYMMQSQKRQVNTLNLKGGWTALEYAGGERSIPLLPDQYCPEGTMYLIDSKDFKLYELADWNWFERDGAILHRISNTPAYEAALYKYADLGCSKPRGLVVLTGITEH